MSRFRKVDVRIWNDEKFRSLSLNGKLVFLFVMTHPGMTPLGAMRATVPGLAAELDMDTEAFREAFREALAKELVSHDERASFVALPNFVKYNRPESPNVAKAWAQSIDLIPECSARARHFAGVKAFVEGMDEAFLKALPEALLKPCPKAMPNQEQEPEPEPEQEHLKNKASRVSGSQEKKRTRKSGPLAGITETEMRDVGALVKRHRCIANLLPALGFTNTPASELTFVGMALSALEFVAKAGKGDPVAVFVSNINAGRHYVGEGHDEAARRMLNEHRRHSNGKPAEFVTAAAGRLAAESPLDPEDLE